MRRDEIEIKTGEFVDEGVVCDLSVDEESLKAVIGPVLSTSVQ